MQLTVNALNAAGSGMARDKRQVSDDHSVMMAAMRIDDAEPNENCHFPISTGSVSTPCGAFAKTARFI